ncbi:MAG: helix-turn-helix domain-containing protein [Candidatus ainarchaeum sp.]|nr:helix-turn-helix domain-containing protein [Candidatus ainarchaeum sp.]
MDAFKVLGNENRMRMLRILLMQSRHISGLAKELNISVPVALRHARILEQAGFVERQKAGNTHFLVVPEKAANRIKKALGLFEKSLVIEVAKGTKMLEALKKISGLKIEETKEGAFITEVEGKKGYYLYEVNGKLPSKPIDSLKINKNLEIEFKQLLPVVGKKISIKIK